MLQCLHDLDIVPSMLPQRKADEARANKRAKIQKYLKYSQDLGIVESGQPPTDGDISKLARDAIKAIDAAQAEVVKITRWECVCGHINPISAKLCTKCMESRVHNLSVKYLTVGAHEKSTTTAATWRCNCGHHNPTRNGMCDKCLALRDKQ